MRSGNTKKYLQKPKRIRKSKKEFLRGEILRTETKHAVNKIGIPLPYLFLFFALTATIIGYTSFSFLFSRIHIDGSMFNFVSAALSIIHLPQIPHVTMPRIDISFMITPILSYFNPIPYWTVVFSTSAQMTAVFSIWIITQTYELIRFVINSAQTTAISLWRSAHPVQLLETALSAIASLSISIMLSISNGTLWVIKTAAEYISMVGTGISAAGLFVFNAGAVLGMYILHAIIFISLSLIELTFQHITAQYQSVITTSSLLLDFINTDRTLTNQVIIVISIQIWELLVLIYTILLYGITLLWNGMLHVLTIIFDWILSVLMAIKRSIDAMFGAIGAGIHLCDPLYAAIGSSVKDLFGGMGATFSVTSNAISGGKL